MTTPKSAFLPVGADALARLYSAEATGFMVQCMRGEVAGIKPSERLKAAQTLLERGHGKAVQAVISVPARAAVAKKLAGLDDDALLAIAKGGSTPGKRGPQAGGNGAGTHKNTFSDPTAFGQEPTAVADDDEDPSSQELRAGGSMASSEVPKPRAWSENGEGGVGVQRGTQVVPVQKSKWDAIAEDAVLADSDYDPLS